MDKYTRFLKSEVKKMEQEKLVSEGMSDFFFELRQNLLTQSSPTTFTGQEIIDLGRTHGFEETILDESCYMGTAFFVSFKKLQLNEI
ncbi:MAG: hypothetical protein Q8T08_06365 [Ignavibacteria bacterium]|nr:hypothetical protein [Ignavibacteria bacterium]